MKTVTQAEQLLEHIDADAADPDENSRALVQASLAAQSARLSQTMQLPEDVMLQLEQSLVRVFHGDVLADTLA